MEKLARLSYVIRSGVDDVLDRMFAQIKTGLENLALPRSDFTISKILYLDVDFHTLRLTRGSPYVELPKWVASKKAIINPKNEDKECFKWAIIASLHHDEIEKDPQRISKLKHHVDLYNWDGIEFPTSIKSIYKFEANNPDIVVNVLYIDEKRINILRRSVHNGRTKVVTLLLITNDKKTHYTAVKSLSRLLGKETLKNRNPMHFYLSCQQGFPTAESRDKHYRYCIDHEAVKITMPNEAKKWLYYRDGQQQFKVSFAIYADFESLLVPVEDARDTKTERLSKHVPSGWCTYNTFAYGDVLDPLKVYRGEDSVTRFVNHPENEVKRLYYTYPQQPMTKLTEVLKREHDEATHCHICLKPFDNYENNRKGAHLFIREFSEKYDTQDIGCIAKNTEKYISFNVINKVPLGGMAYGDGERYKTIEIQFIDSCRFMASSLNKLASNLSDDQCKNLRWFFTKDDLFKLMRRKGVYPYEYMDGWQRFEETELPLKEAFYSKLNMDGISDEDYQYAKMVWNCITPGSDDVTMGDYQDVYLTTDVLLLAAILLCTRVGLEGSPEIYGYNARASHRSRHVPDVRKRYPRRPYTGMPKPITSTWESSITPMRSSPTSNI
ncbi:uncharacterized protein LOC130648044 [Hydractinia symbiolongicarpus]|uniref:uncharacterized protein LOC130648044 n=1 Tax=Hydractinia symbiolongicarpus TaxID=13093 RepID=UPI00254CE0EC|nr:uncharacterized protein LOC130648044 [Hydractinia symbiolongicarpus]